jgi:Ca2+-binding EF-hand superfamily protein
MPPLPLPEPIEVPEQPEPNPKEEPTDEMKLKDASLVQSFIDKLEEVLNNPERYGEVLNAAFESIDVDGKGSIERSEVENLVICFAKETQVTISVDEQTLEEFFKLFDKEKEETITKEELEEPLKAMITAWISFLKEKLAEAS